MDPHNMTSNLRKSLSLTNLTLAVEEKSFPLTNTDSKLMQELQMEGVQEVSNQNLAMIATTQQPRPRQQSPMQERLQAKSQTIERTQKSTTAQEHMVEESLQEERPQKLRMSGQ